MDKINEDILKVLNMVLDQAISNNNQDNSLLELKKALECASHRLIQKKIYEVHNQVFIQTAINEDILGELYLYRLYRILENQNTLDQNLIVNYLKDEKDKKDTNLINIMSPLKMHPVKYI